MADPTIKKIDQHPNLVGVAAIDDKVLGIDTSQLDPAQKTVLISMNQISIHTASQLAADVVESVQIKDAAVTATKIGADAVSGTKIADDSIDSEHYVDGSIDAAHLNRTAGSEAVTTAAIRNGSITLAKMASNSIDSDQYVDGSIDTVHLANEAVTEAKLGAIKRTVAVPVFGFEDNVIVKNFTNLFSFPPMLNGHVITSVSATLLGAVSVSGALTIKLINGLNEMASVTINQNAWSGTATPNTSYDDVASFGKFSVNVTGAGSGAKGLTVYLEVTG